MSSAPEFGPPHGKRMLLPCVVSPVSLRRGALPREVWPCPSVYWDLPSSDVMLPAGPADGGTKGSPQV